jgi:hypothetical protein
MPRTRRAVALFVLVTFVGAEAGCSWIFMKKEPPLPIEPTPPVECTSSATAPIVDTVVAVATGVTAIVGVVGGLIVLQDSTGWEGLNAAGWIGVGILAALFPIPTGFSAAYGFKHANACERLKALQAACVSGDQDACTRLRGERPAPKEQPGTSPSEGWLQDAASQTSARLWPPKEQDQ